MTDIVINRCSLKIVRKNGWSWGPEPDRLLKRAIGALPDLIARSLDGLWSDDVSYEIATPVRITVPVTFDELVRAGSDFAAGTNEVSDARSSVLDARISHALRTTLGFVEPRTIEPNPAEDLSIGIGKQTTRTNSAGELGVVDAAVPQVLLRWYDEGVLADRLAFFSPLVLKAWYSILVKTNVGSAWRGSPLPGRTSPLAGAGEVARANGRSPATRRTSLAVEGKSPVSLRDIDAIRAMVRRFASPASDGSRALLQRLIVTVSLAAETGLSPSDPTALSVLDAEFPDFEAHPPIQTGKSNANIRSDSGKEDSTKAKRSSLNGTTEPKLPQQTAPAERAWERSGTGEIDIASALPFLLLGPLSRIGYLRVLAATFEAARLGPHMPAFATALAYNVLEPPERGWRRNASARTSAAVFAALTSPLDDSDLHLLDQNLADHISPLEAALVGPLVEGHRADQPLLLLETGSQNTPGLLLVDVEGLFPLLWSPDAEGLVPLLRKCSGSTILVPSSTAGPGLLAWLDSQDLCFVTDAPPTRGESWREIRQRGIERWWTNDQTSSRSDLVKKGRRLKQADDDATELWQVLSVDRPTTRTEQISTLDGHLTRVAATALGTLAFELWGDREVSVPQLALARFGDLGARVVFTPEFIRVTLPLGRRHQDLREHGFLENISDVPWLGGRLLQFSGG